MFKTIVLKPKLVEGFTTLGQLDLSQRHHTVSYSTA